MSLRFGRPALFVAALVSGIAVLAGCGQKTSLDKEFDAYQSSVEAEAAHAEEAGKAYLAGVAKEPGVVVLPSGLMYKVVANPDPKGAQPKVSDTVKINYEGKLVNGDVFDSSYARHEPATFPLERLIKAWQIAIPMMHKGDTIMLYVPPELGYGSQAAPDGSIPANSVLVFKVELLDINPK